MVTAQVDVGAGRFRPQGFLAPGQERSTLAMGVPGSLVGAIFRICRPAHQERTMAIPATQAGPVSVPASRGRRG